MPHACNTHMLIFTKIINTCLSWWVEEISYSLHNQSFWPSGEYHTHIIYNHFIKFFLLWCLDIIRSTFINWILYFFCHVFFAVASCALNQISLARKSLNCDGVIHTEFTPNWFSVFVPEWLSKYGKVCLCSECKQLLIIIICLW